MGARIESMRYGRDTRRLDRIADPLFTAGLDPAEYLRQLHEGELA
jgi:hypothetical protein